MAPRNQQLLAATLATCLGSAALAAPPCESINFDDIPAGPAGVFTSANQPYLSSKGVSISATCGNPFIDTILGPWGNPGLVPPSAPNVLSSPTGDPLTDCCMSITFNTPQNWVRLEVAASLWATNTPQTALIVTAYSANTGGAILSKPMVLTHLQGSFTPNPQLQWSTALFDLGLGNCDIGRIEICTAGSGALMSQFYVDDLEFGNDQNRPTVIIDNPPEKGCLCDGYLVVDGSICDDGCGDVEAELRIRPIVKGATSTWGGPPWVSLATTSPPLCVSIPGLFTYSLPAAQFPEGEYLLQVDATDACGRSGTDERVVLIDRNAPNITLNCPVNGQIVNRKLDLVGSITDLCLKSWEVRFGPHPSSSGYPVIASGTTNVGPVIASVNTTTYPDGQYQLRVRALDECNRRSREIRTVTIDNTPPIAQITSPDPCLVKCQDDMTFVMGIIDDAHLAGWKLEFKMGSDPSLPPGVSPPWMTIATGSIPIGNSATGTPGLIAVWDQCGLPNCCYQLRLTAWDRAGSCPSATSGSVGPNVTIDEMCANLGLAGDTNGDGIINSIDLQIMLGNWGGCPSCP